MNDRLSSNSGHHGISTEGQVEGEMGGKRGGGGSWSGRRRVLMGRRRVLVGEEEGPGRGGPVTDRGLGGRDGSSRGPIPSLLKMGD